MEEKRQAGDSIPKEGEPAHKRVYIDPDALEYGPTEEEVEAWAEVVRARRKAWAQGPTEEEKAAWARRERQRRILMAEGDTGYCGPSPRSRSWEYDRDPHSSRIRRETEWAALGAWDWWMNLPYNFWSDLIGRGQYVEQRGSRPLRRRIIYDDCD